MCLSLVMFFPPHSLLPACHCLDVSNVEAWTWPAEHLLPPACRPPPSRLLLLLQLKNTAKKLGLPVYALTATSTSALLRNLCPLLGLDPLAVAEAVGAVAGGGGGSGDWEEGGDEASLTDDSGTDEEGDQETAAEVQCGGWGWGCRGGCCGGGWGGWAGFNEAPNG